MGWSTDITLIPSLHTLSISVSPILPDTGRFLDYYRMPQLQYFTLSMPSILGDHHDAIEDHLYTVQDFMMDTPTISAVTLKSGIRILSYALKILWTPSPYLGPETLPGVTDLTISVWKDLVWSPGDITQIQCLINARLEGPRAKLRPLQRLSVPRFIFEDDADWIRGEVPELELTD
ncbi:uncharacterized protein EI90DRAFT_3061699 [Cantharellus anzutake]|uniref:uncharacterized protein n=1 Tax=Cantharellus anzutake TaxID=1750568 RepID=UPI001904EC7D|nr:uncharacterized protein EI90DRAFT_3061699 [Cantharellus anzutake]KAF8329722.1 hypothetical protein EI90DRAFT_3061699 [Cantharellus anzutake]